MLKGLQENHKFRATAIKVKSTMHRMTLMLHTELTKVDDHSFFFIQYLHNKVGTKKVRLKDQ